MVWKGYARHLLWLSFNDLCIPILSSVFHFVAFIVNIFHCQYIMVHTFPVAFFFLSTNLPEFF